MINNLILYIGGFQLPEGNAASQRVINNSKLLSKLGYEVVLKGFTKFDDTPSSDESICFKYETSEYPKSSIKWFKYLFSISSIKKTIKRIGKPKYIIAYNYPSVAMLKMIRFCKKNQIHLISDCSEWYGFQGKNIFLAIIKFLDSTITMRYVNKVVDGLIVISPYLLNFYRLKKNIILIPPLVDKNDFMWSKKDNDINNEHVNVLYFGSMGKHKDRISEFLKVLYYNTNIHVLIIGSSRTQYLKFYPKDSKVIYDLGDRIKFINRLNHLDTILYLNAARYVVFFRDFTKIANKAGFPTKFVEAYSCSVPVITNHNRNLFPFLSDGKNGLVVEYTNSRELRTLSMKLTKDQSINLSNNIDNMMFHYENYMHEMNMFLNHIDEAI